MATTRKTRSKTERVKKAGTPRKSTAASTSAQTSITTIIEAKPHETTKFITRQAIAEAAYYLWQKRGGDDVINWLEAEAWLKRQAVSA